MKAYALSFNESSILDQWDSGFLLDMLEQIGIKPIPVKRLEKAENAIVIIPARHHKGMENQIQKELDKINNCIFFALGDEEAEFNVHKIRANYIYVQNPHPGQHDMYDRIGTGYPPQIKLLDEVSFKKDFNVFFSGQNTHTRRQQALKHLNNFADFHEGLEIYETKGFTQGLSHKEYYDRMARAKIAPCPSGAVIPDSFRLFEAFESMAVAIADEVNPSGSIQEYWDWLFEEVNPIIKIKDWSEVGGKILEILEDWDSIVQKQTCWWLLYKRNFRLRLVSQLNEKQLNGRELNG